MRCDRLEKMTGGWFVGDFEPTVYRTTAVEVAVKRYAAGAREAKHHHKVATEITVIVSGTATMNDRTFSDGDVITLEPGESVAFHAVTDVVTAVVKLPSVKGDKYVDE